jgi:GxxExxY protein
MSKNIVYHGDTASTAEKRMIECPDQLSTLVLDAAFEVHRELGPGLLESVYEAAIGVALNERNISWLRQVEIPARFHGKDLGIGFRADMIVGQCLLLEIKAVEAMLPIHQAQIMTYLRLLNIKCGYLLNFNERLLKTGIKRVSL